MAILAGLPAKNDSTGFQQESQGHDKDLKGLVNGLLMKLGRCNCDNNSAKG